MLGTSELATHYQARLFQWFLEVRADWGYGDKTFLVVSNGNRDPTTYPSPNFFN
jgi:hypothetical protein